MDLVSIDESHDVFFCRIWMLKTYQMFSQSLQLFDDKISDEIHRYSHSYLHKNIFFPDELDISLIDRWKTTMIHCCWLTKSLINNVTWIQYNQPANKSVVYLRLFQFGYFTLSVSIAQPCRGSRMTHSYSIKASILYYAGKHRKVIKTKFHKMFGQWWKADLKSSFLLYE